MLFSLSPFRHFQLLEIGAAQYHPRLINRGNTILAILQIWATLRRSTCRECKHETSESPTIRKNREVCCRQQGATFYSENEGLHTSIKQGFGRALENRRPRRLRSNKQCHGGLPQEDSMPKEKFGHHRLTCQCRFHVQKERKRDSSRQNSALFRPLAQARPPSQDSVSVWPPPQAQPQEPASEDTTESPKR